MESIAFAPKERKDLICKMKRESKSSRKLRMHIILLACDGRSPTEIARTLFCSRTTVYSIVGRFMQEGRAAFDDRKRRGPAPLVDDSAQELIEELTEEVLPTERGWLRSRWGCKLLAVELFKERALMVSRETVRRVLHRLEFCWRRPRPVAPPKNPEQKRERLQDILQMLHPERSFFQDETKLETNPKVGFCWMRKGMQRKLPTPGTNRKVWISGALEFSTGSFHWVTGERKNDELFMKLLEHLRQIYDHRRLELAVDNDASHTSKRVQRYVEDSGGGLRLHALPAWKSPEQPGGVGLVVFARSGKPQPSLQRFERSGWVRGGLSRRETALPSPVGGRLRAVGEVSALRSASVHLSRGAI
jgi:transposase